MTYDKDIRACRMLMIILGVLMVGGFVINLLARDWIAAGSFVVWTWGCLVYVRNAESHQRTRDETRAGMADMMRTWTSSALHKDGFQVTTPPLEPGDAAVDAMDKAYGYRSYTCPKCGRLSHLPAEVEPYCVACLAEFEKSDWRG